MSREHVEDLAAFAAGLPVPAGLEEHLAQCQQCRAELSELRTALALADDAVRPLASAEPSPALRARIREAVAAAEPTGWIAGWRFAWTAAATAMVLAAAFAGWWMLQAGRPSSGAATALATASAPGTAATAQPGVAADAASADTASVAPAAAPTRSAAVVAPTSNRAAAGRTRPSQALPRRAEPEVLVPSGGEQALLQLVALVHQQKSTPAALLAAGEPSADLPGPAAIDIKPLEIVPLDPAEAQGT
jgi:hypothetical protein